MLALDLPALGLGLGQFLLGDGAAFGLQPVDEFPQAILLPPALYGLRDIAAEAAGADLGPDGLGEFLGERHGVLLVAEATTSESARHALKDYVVTERLLENSDEALALIKSALDGHRSKAAYLHGSFGSGKSHFMAVLYALLSGDPAARSRTEFDPVLTKHEWLSTDGKKFLLVPYHMLGAKALEQRVLGGYVHHVKKPAPEAPTPRSTRPTPSSRTSAPCAPAWATRPSSGVSGSSVAGSPCRSAGRPRR